MATRGGSTRWKPGQSGNPTGKNGREKLSQLRGLLDPHAEALVDKAREMALQGDTVALRLCLERITPPVRAPRDQPVYVKNLKAATSLVERGQAIIDALACGEITPSEGASLMTSVAALARVLEVDELERRLAILEEAHGD